MNIVLQVVNKYGPCKIQKIRDSEDEISVISEIDNSLGLATNGNLTDKGREVVEFANANHNPSNRTNTNTYQNFEQLKRCEWVCSECQLLGAQPAANIRDFRDEGFEFDSESGMGYVSRKHCQNCETRTTHRRMMYPFPTKQKTLRATMTDDFRDRVKREYDNRDVIDDVKKNKDELEIDHRVPRIRCQESETGDFASMTSEDIRDTFQTISSSNNQRKSRACERCKKTGCRQTPCGIEFFYKGGEEYDKEIGCEGCFYYNPDKWREEYNSTSDKDNDKENTHIKIKNIIQGVLPI